MTSSPLPGAAILSSGCRQNAMGSEALSWLVSCFFSLPIPLFSSQMFSVSRPVAGGGGRARDGFAVVV